MRSSETPAATSALPTNSLINELSQQFKATAESVVPWFVAQMPQMYFQDTSPARVQNHLRAIIAAKASGNPLDLTIRSDDGKEWTMIRPGNRVGVLSEIVAQLPMNEPLRAATFSTVRMFTTDGPTCSTRSVKSGKVRVCACAGITGARARVAPSARAATRSAERSVVLPI